MQQNVPPRVSGSLDFSYSITFQLSHAACRHGAARRQNKSASKQIVYFLEQGRKNNDSALVLPPLLSGIAVRVTRPDEVHVLRHSRAIQLDFAAAAEAPNRSRPALGL